MIKLENSAANQQTMKDGAVSDWVVSLDGEELYKLPAILTPQNTFEIRRIIEKMMDYAHKQGMLEAETKKDLEIEQILETGNAQLDALVAHNESLAGALARHMEKGI